MTRRAGVQAGRATRRHGAGERAGPRAGRAWGAQVAAERWALG